MSISIDEIRQKALNIIIKKIFTHHENGDKIRKEARSYTHAERDANDARLFDFLSQNDGHLKKVFPEYPNVTFERGKYIYSLFSAVSKEGLKNTQRYFLGMPNLDICFPSEKGQVCPLRAAIKKGSFLCAHNILSSKKYADLSQSQKAEMFMDGFGEEPTLLVQLSSLREYEDRTFRRFFQEFKTVVSSQNRADIYLFSDKRGCHILHDLAAKASMEAIHKVILDGKDILESAQFLEWINRSDNAGCTPHDIATITKNITTAKMIGGFGGKARKFDPNFVVSGANGGALSSLDIPPA